MGKLLWGTLLLVLALISLPLLLGGGGGTEGAEAVPAPTASAVPSFTPSDAPSDSVDGEHLVWVSDGAGGAEELSLRDYLPGVVAAEMPAAYHPDALRAQAVAARTYILYKETVTTAAHPEAAVCRDSSCCKAWLSPQELQERWGDNYSLWWDKICAAVADTDGMYLSYDGQVIQAVFHASSPGRTESSSALWSAEPYLVSVDSPETAETVANLVSQVTVDQESFRGAILALDAGAVLEGDPGGWVGEASLTEGGRVDTISIGGVSLSGQDLRTAFSLRSAAFTLSWDGSAFVFTVSGYGHGVGMSQVGADLLAEEGMTWEDILSHYYPGTTLERLGN
jgi:stage II sporulation protein D